MQNSHSLNVLFQMDNKKYLTIICVSHFYATNTIFVLFSFVTAMSRRFAAKQALQRLMDLSSDVSGSDCDSEIGEETSPDTAIPTINLSAEESSESDTDSIDKSEQSAFTSPNGTTWTPITTSMVGRTASHNIFTARCGPGNYTIRSVYDAWKRFIDRKTLLHIVECTKEMATLNGDHDFDLDVNELESFIARQYARGIYGKNAPCFFLVE